MKSSQIKNSSVDTMLPSVGTEKKSVEDNKKILEASKNAELFENLNQTKENLNSLEQDIIAGDQEKLEQKNFTWDERTKTLSYFYIIGKRDIFMSLQVIEDDIKVVFDATNTLGWNYEKEDRVITINKKDINDLPEKIRSTFASGFDFKTAFGSKENLKVSRTDVLQKIEEKAETAIKIVKKQI